MSVDVKWLICLLLTAISQLHQQVAVDGRLDVNVALNRPSYQVSTYAECSQANPPENANDGGHATDLCHGSCAVTNHSTNPWWAVDLGVPLHVAAVKFTNRNVAGYRAHNFIIGMTDVSPAVVVPTLWDYHVCGQYPGAVPDGATVTMLCTTDMPAYRYLVLQFSPSDGFANFCELEVYIRRWEYENQRGQKMINKVASTMQVEERVYCMTNCSMSPVCDSYNFRNSGKTSKLDRTLASSSEGALNIHHGTVTFRARPPNWAGPWQVPLDSKLSRLLYNSSYNFRNSDNTCELNTHDTPLIANSADIVSDIDWNWWKPTFTTVQ